MLVTRDSTYDFSYVGKSSSAKRESFFEIPCSFSYLREVRGGRLRRGRLLLEDVDLLLVVAAPSDAADAADAGPAVRLLALVLVSEVVVLRPARLGLAARPEAAPANVHQGGRRRHLDGFESLIILQKRNKYCKVRRLGFADFNFALGLSSKMGKDNCSSFQSFTKSNMSMNILL